MADARVATSNDDDRTLGIMERVRLFMNKVVIPAVTGLAPGVVVFKWGAKDAFDIEFPEAIREALNSKVITNQQAILMLETQYHWKIPQDEDIIERFGEIEEIEEPTEEPKEEPSKEPPKGIESHDESWNRDIDRKLKNEKLVAYDTLNRKIKEI